MDVIVVKEIKATVVKTTVLAVTIANGSVMRCDSHYPKLTWFMQGHEFQADLRVLKIGRCNIVLDMNWLKVYSLILFNFIKMKLSFRKKKKNDRIKRND
jgi:hypothetical protein